MAICSHCRGELSPRVSISCPNCARRHPANTFFCESCGQRIPPSLACRNCEPLAFVPVTQPGDTPTDHLSALVSRGVMLAQQGSHDQALAQFQAVLEHDPTNHDVRRWLAHCYAAVGQTDVALQQYQYLLAVDPTDQRTTDYLVEADPYGTAVNAERTGKRFGGTVTPEQAQAAGYPGWRDLQSWHYEHPSDRQMRDAWANDGAMIEATSQTLQQVMGPQTQRELLLGCVRLGEQQLPETYTIAQRSASMLNQPMPEIYLHAEPTYNAQALNAGRCFVMLNSALVDDFTPDELLFVIGHEMGHIKSDHTLYNAVGQAVIEKQYSRAESVSNVGGGLIGIVTSVAGAAMAAHAERLAHQYLSWRPYTELTCDRAGLIACGNVDVAASALAKLMLGSAKLAASLNLGALLRQYDDAQAAELLAAIDPTDELQNSHPYTCYRIRLLQAWAMSSQYKGLAALRHPVAS